MFSTSQKLNMFLDRINIHRKIVNNSVLSSLKKYPMSKVIFFENIINGIIYQQGCHIEYIHCILQLVQSLEHLIKHLLGFY